jgi:malonyl-CoA/methylmalonyl-CoA synthetase
LDDLEYWGRPKETQKAFRDGWFLTGDVAVVENGIFRILGRSSVDIIKTGGYKVSALEIEEVLLAYPDIKEVAVVGVPDQVWGERIVAALVLRAGAHLTTEALRAWGKERLATYKVPKEAVIIEELPRNAMGKVSKPRFKEDYRGEALTRHSGRARFPGRGSSHGHPPLPGFHGSKGPWPAAYSKLRS